MAIWDRLPHESVQQYEGFTLYIDSNPRRTNKDIAELAKAGEHAVGDWKKKFTWEERAEAYDRWVEENNFEKRETILRERAQTISDKMVNNLLRMLLENELYQKELTAKGIDSLKTDNIHDLRDLANENIDLISKGIRALKEILPLTPEGQKLLGDQDKQGSVVIQIPQATTPAPQYVDSEVEEAPQIQFEEVKADGSSAESTTTDDSSVPQDTASQCEDSSK